MQHDLDNFGILRQVLLTKVVAFTNTGISQTNKFTTEKSILGWNLTSGKAAFQLNSKIKDRNILNVTDLQATNIHGAL